VSSPPLNFVVTINTAMRALAKADTPRMGNEVGEPLTAQRTVIKA
jgi:hypothetical protein